MSYFLSRSIVRSGFGGGLGGRLGCWLSERLFSRFSIAARITAITLTLAVPLNLVIAAVIWRLSEGARETQQTSLLYTARSVAAAVDAKLGEYMDFAQALARSPALVEDNLEGFEAEARRAFTTPDALVMVADLEGQQLINTVKQPGQRLPVRGPVPFAVQKRAFETRSTVITGVRLGIVSLDWIISIEVPIFKNGQPFRALSVAVRVESFFRLLNAQQMPEGWLACIFDHQGRFVARVPGHERNVGHLAPEGFLKVKDQDGIFEFLSAEGIPIMTANTHSAASGWPVAIAVKKAEMQAAAWTTIRWATILGGSFSVLSLMFAGAIARSITGPIEKLRQKAGVLLAEPAPLMRPVGPPEVRDLCQALKESAARRDRSDRALRESEEKLRLALDAAELGIWRWDVGKGAKEMHWDSRCRALFGVSDDACVTYESWANCIVPEDRARTEANVARALDPDDPHDETVCEYRVRHPDGKVLWLYSTGRVFFEPDAESTSGRRVAFKSGAIRDVTKVHLAEAALRESEQRLRLSNEAAGIGTFTIDPESGCVHYSPELAAMLGFPGVTITKIENAFARVHRDDLYSFRIQYQAGLSGRGAGQIRADFRFVRPGGEIRWMTWAGRVHFRDGPSGRRPFRIDGACVDITDRKRTEEELRKSEERFRGVFENAATGIAITDIEGGFQSCNPAYSRMIGYSEQEFRQQPLSTFMHPEDRDANVLQCKRLAAQEIASFEIVNRYLRKDGKALWVDKHVSLLRDSAGQPSHIIVLAMDITERKRQDDQIRLLMREVNHRSKNMLSLVQAVARQTLAANPEDFLERFEKRVEALAANQDLLVKNAWKGAGLDEIVRSQLAPFEDLIGTRIEVRGPPVFVSASAAQVIGMALHELATNAGKYGALSGSDGRVEIAWRIQRDDAFVMSWREECAHPITAPSKLGFGSSVISSMAEMSLGAKVELNFPATGLVWQLSCAAAEISDGDVRSRPSGETEGIAGDSTLTTQRPRILVVEDEAVVAIEIARVLTEAGFDIVGPARGVSTAMELLKRGDCHAAVLDINLGSETSEAIATALKASTTPFVALSGYARNEYPPVFADAPALMKPLRPQLLVAELRKCIEVNENESLERA
ncbi:MAG: PAS domain S-box protein [Rhodomicrobium sp.]